MSGSSFKLLNLSPLCAEISPFWMLPKFHTFVNKKIFMNVPISLQCNLLYSLMMLL